jgi:type II secretory pathway pseudopilin PulG
MNIRKRRNRQAGDTIVEVLIAMAVIAMILAGAFVVTSRSTHAVRDSEEHAQALELLQGEVERVRSQAMSSTSAVYGPNIFCIDNANTVQTGFGFAAIPPLATDSWSQYPAACQGIDNLYNEAVSYDSTSHVFTFVARWDGITHDRSQVELFYRIQPIAASAPPAAPSGCANSGYTVTASTIYDATCNPHIFHGLVRPSMEWSATGQNLSLGDYTLMSSWQANIVRLPLNEKFWIQNTSNYRSRVDQQVQWITSLGMDVLLTLQWSDGGNIGNTVKQYQMPDQDSNTFWQDVASIYQTNSHVLFELYNEPYGVSWNVWRNGGAAPGFTAVGMQQLYDTVRATGAQNLVLIGGLNYAFDLSGVPANRITGSNIVYATHPYDQPGKNTMADWDTAFGGLSATDPVMMTEFGDFNCSTTFYSQLLSYASSHNISWTAFAWYPGGCGFPSLINNWSGAPSAPGAVVKAAM